MPYKNRSKHQKSYTAWLNKEKDARWIETIEALSTKTVTGEKLSFKNLLWYMTVALHEKITNEDLYLRPADPTMGDVYDRFDEMDATLRRLTELVRGIKSISVEKIASGDVDEAEKLKTYQTNVNLLEGITSQYGELEFYDEEDEEDEDEAQ